MHKFIFYPLISAWFFMFFNCTKTKEPTESCSNLNYFLSNIGKTGYIIENDTVYDERSGRYRSIKLFNVAATIYSHSEITIRREVDSHTRFQICRDIMFPILKDLNGIQLFREPAPYESGLPDISTWRDFFSKDTMLYEVNTWAINYGKLHWFTKKFHTVLYAQKRIKIDSILTQMRNDQECDYVNTTVQNEMRIYRTNKDPQNGNVYYCYTGKITLYNGDTLTPNDSAAFRDCVIRYRRDHGLEPAFIIDTCLLKSLKIPLNPIEEGLKRYHKEFAEKSR